MRCARVRPARADSFPSTCWFPTTGAWPRRTGSPRKSNRACARWCRTLPSSPTSSRSRTRPPTTTSTSTARSVARQDDLDVVPADVDEGGRQDLPPADLQLPDLGIHDRDEIARLGHEVRDARARNQVDVALDAVARREDRDFRFLFHGQSMRQVSSKVSRGLRGGMPFPVP